MLFIERHLITRAKEPFDSSKYRMGFSVHNTDKPIIDILTLRKDLYLVMSLLLADREVAKVPNVVGWTKIFYESEVSRLLLWVATAVRGLLDLLEESNDSFSKKDCGEYWADFSKSSKDPLTLKSSKDPLTFRQACNSVIHAKEILPYQVPQRKSKRTVKRVYTDRITVRGTYKQKTTRAQLDIIKFVQIADALINSFQEDDNANG